MTKMDLNETNIILICEGLDTVATILINGKQAGTTENMFRRYVFQIKPYLQEGSNLIEVNIFELKTKSFGDQVSFESAIKYSKRKEKEYPYHVPFIQFPTGEGRRHFIRKEQNSFAWDWYIANKPIIFFFHLHF